MRRLFPLFILLFLSLIVSGQDETDALRFARHNTGGTARSVAMGGAFGALGGDFSSASQNPAGLGVYRSSELSFTPELFYNYVDARYNGINTQDWAYNANFNHFSFVSDFKFKNSDFKGGSFAVGFVNLNNFSRNMRVEGNNTSSSFADPYVVSANNGGGGSIVAPYALDPYSEKLFFDGYIIDWVEEDHYFLNRDMRDSLGNLNMDQVKTSEQSGMMNEWSMSLGLNYKHLFYFGGSFTIIPVDFREESTFTESDGILANQEYFWYNKIVLVDGTGYSGKLGFIFKPLKALRVGMSYHFPTKYFMTNTSYASLDSYLEGEIVPVDEQGYELGDQKLDYTLITPGKAVGSLGLMVKKFMVLTTDIEFIDYSFMRLGRGSDGYNFGSENSEIEAKYTYALNVKSGMELRAKSFYFRGGFGFFGSPYKTGTSNVEAYRLNYSGGLGYRAKQYFVDFAVAYSGMEDEYALYDSQFAMSTLNSHSVKVMTTVGFRFK